MDRLTIAMYQMDVEYGMPKQNRDKVVRFFEELEQRNVAVDIILLPELWNTSYDLTRLDEIADEDGKETQMLLSEAAKKLGSFVIGGSIAEKRQDGVYNTSYVYNRNGELIHRYSKAHLFRLMDEEKYLSAGQEMGLFQIEGYTALCNICYDIRFPEGIRTKAVEGAEILFVSAQWPHPRLNHWRQLLIARAIENQMFVVACNRVGEDPKNTFCGHSMIIDPWGEILVEGMQKEEILIGEIDLQQVADVRRKIPIFEDRRTDLYFKS